MRRRFSWRRYRSRGEMPAPGAALGRGSDVRVWFAGVNWDDVQGTDRSLVEAHTRPVVWVDRGTSPLRGGRVWPSRRPLQVIRADPPLLRLVPVVPPFPLKPVIRWMAPRLVRSQVRTALQEARLTPTSVVSTYLTPAGLGWGPGVTAVLYGTDDYVAGAELMHVSRGWLERLEARSVRGSDVVLAVSDHLAARWRRYRTEVLVLRNGCRIEAEPEPAGPRPSATPDQEDPGEPPVLGVVGQLNARIDIETLESVAHGGFRLLLVGPVDPQWVPERVSALCSRPNVEAVGRVAASEVGQYLARMDVGLTPYCDTTFNAASFPLKSLEYLGAGVPVVASDIAPSRWLREDVEGCLGSDAADRHVRLARRPDDVPRQARELLAAQRPGDSRGRRQYAARHSWDARAHQLDEIVG